MGVFTDRFLIRFSHADPAGIVYYPNYFDMFNSAFEDWFLQALGIDYAAQITSLRLGFPTVHAECDFRRPCRMGEFLDLAVLLTRIGRTSIAITYVGSVAGEERLRANNVLVTIHLDTGEAVPIPDDLRRAFESYRAACADG